MAWIYPVNTVNRGGWYSQPPDMLPHLCLHPDANFETFVWTYADYDNYLVVDMGQSCTQCVLWAKRGTSILPISSLTVYFYNAQNQLVDTWVIDLTLFLDWSQFEYTPVAPWRYVRFEGISDGPTIAVAELRGFAFTNPTKRLLTGVGL